MVYFKQFRRGSKTSSTKSTKLTQSRKRLQTSASTASNEPQRRRITLNSRPASAYPQTESKASVASESQSELHVVQEDDDDNLDHVIMAVDKTGKATLGCSYYVVREGVLRCMEDVDDSEEDILNSLKLDIRPTVLLISHRSENLSEHEIARQSSLGLSEDDQPTLPYKLELRPSSDFRYEHAVHKLATISSLEELPGVKFLVPGEEEEYDEGTQLDEMGLSDERGRALHLSGSVNLESRVSVGCAGAIITYVQRKRASEYLQGDPAAKQAYQILRLEMFSLKNTILVNTATLAALQILQPESHPNASTQGPGTYGAKEFLSVYGLFYHFARTPQGKIRLRHMFLHPSLDMDLIKNRHDSINVFARSENLSAVQSMSMSLSKIKNVRRVMTMLHKGIEGGNLNSTGINSGVWSSLLDFCYHVIDLSDILDEVTGIALVSISRRLRQSFKRSEFQRLGKIMFDVVDLEESQSQRRTVVKRGMDEELDAVKDAYDSMDETLQQTAIETVPELQLPAGAPVPDLTVVYIPQLGFHVQLPLRAAGELMERGLNPDWERTFTTDAQAYFKTNRMRQMDGGLGDLWVIICDREIEISHDLAQKVLEHGNLLVEASDICGELDCLLALAHGVSEYKLCRPWMVQDNIIDIRGGRHLIQELTVPSYVANDTFLVGGPNYSGKSVYLKQVALIVYMAQVGSFVPAEHARLGITDKIMTRITTRETVSKGQSSFMIDLQQIALAVNVFTPRSLLVIDEFGKGTDNCDGAGLAAGVLSYLLSLGVKAPKVVACAHFHEIFEQGFMSEFVIGLSLRQMEVQVTKKHRRPNETGGAHNSEVVYLYNVRPGRSTLSYGTQCAAMNGMPDVVLERAGQLTAVALRGEDLVSACSGVPPEEYEVLRDADAVSRAFLELDLESVDTFKGNSVKAFLKEFITSSSSVYSSTSRGAGVVQTPSGRCPHFLRKSTS